MGNARKARMSGAVGSASIPFAERWSVPWQEKKSQSPPPATPLADLPSALSAQVPPLRYSSHVYSSTASNRIVTLNGRDFHEGDEVAPGVTLLQILADYSVFRVGSQSFSLASLTDWNGPQ